MRRKEVRRKSDRFSEIEKEERRRRWEGEKCSTQADVGNWPGKNEKTRERKRKQNETQANTEINGKRKEKDKKKTKKKNEKKDKSIKNDKKKGLSCGELE